MMVLDVVMGLPLVLVIVVSDEQGHADEGQQKLNGYDDNVYHNG
jgi:translation elongation factor EF-1beta